MDVVGGVIARLDGPAPVWADRLRWRRSRQTDVALRAVDALVTRRAMVLDVGAMRGDYTSRMLDLVGSRGAVHTFEPNPAHHERLRALGRRRPLHLHPVALSDHDGEATLHIPVVDGRPYLGWASLEAREQAGSQDVTVPIVRLDDLIAPGRRVSFIKCDVEGHEDAVLRGAQALLTRDRPDVLIEIEQRHRTAGVAHAFALFAQLGYDGWAAFPAGLRPLVSFDLERDQLAFLQPPPSGELAPRGYVHNFLFMASDRDLGALVDPAVKPGAPGAQSAARTSA